MSDFVGQPPTPAEGSPIPVDPLLNSLSVEEAAAHLGVSGQTIRRRLQRGEIAGQLVVTTKAREWRVHRAGPFAGVLPPVESPVDVGEQVRAVIALATDAQQGFSRLQQIADGLNRVADALDRHTAALERQEQQAQHHDQQVLIPPPMAPRRAWWRVWGR